MHSNCDCCRDKFLISNFQNNNYFKLLNYCKQGKLNEAKIIASKNIIVVSLNNDFIFRNTCIHGQLKVAKWLINQFPCIDPQTENNEAFYKACLNNFFHMAQWLYNLQISKSSKKIILKKEFIDTISDLKIKNWLSIINE